MEDVFPCVFSDKYDPGTNSTKTLPIFAIITQTSHPSMKRSCTLQWHKNKMAVLVILMHLNQMRAQGLLFIYLLWIFVAWCPVTLGCPCNRLSGCTSSPEQSGKESFLRPICSMMVIIFFWDQRACWYRIQWKGGYVYQASCKSKRRFPRISHANFFPVLILSSQQSLQLL